MSYWLFAALLEDLAAIVRVSMLFEIRDVVLEVRVCKNLIICYDLSCCCWLLMTRIMVILVDVSLILIQCCWL